jgi:hypothetical protein
VAAINLMYSTYYCKFSMLNSGLFYESTTSSQDF